MSKSILNLLCAVAALMLLSGCGPAQPPPVSTPQAGQTGALSPGGPPGSKPTPSGPQAGGMPSQGGAGSLTPGQAPGGAGSLSPGQPPGTP
jgi:hypothetical protein